MTISPCGADCDACGHFPAQCAGCAAIAGKVWWLQYTHAQCCPVSEEENNAHLQTMLQNLKDL